MLWAKAEKKDKDKTFYASNSVLQ